MCLIVETPDTHVPERDYILSVVLGIYLGLSWRRVSTERTDVRISLQDNSGEIQMPDTLFSMSDELWLTPQSLPIQGLELWDSSELNMPLNNIDNCLPIIYGNSDFRRQLSACDQSSVIRDKQTLCIDVFGSAFFMLTRYEEIVKTNRDQHDRFPARDSIAFQEGFLTRPIIDEYIEILWACMKRMWPNLACKRPESRTLISCDVDNPYESYVKYLKSFFRKFGGDIIKRYSLSEAFRSVKNFLFTQTGDYSQDPMNTFDWIMTVNELAGNRVAFYFQVDSIESTYAPHYSIHESRIRALMRRIHERGHEIGLHGSYNTYRNGIQLRREANLLRTIFNEEGINQDSMGSRQHYLRWSTPETARHLDAAGFAYDTTLGYADHIGFRCGTCHEYPMFDIVNRQNLNIRQRPLVVMECSVIDEMYMGLGSGKLGEDYMKNMRDECRRIRGDFTLLWHNSYLHKPEYRRLYQVMIVN